MHRARLKACPRRTPPHEPAPAPSPARTAAHARRHPARGAPARGAAAPCARPARHGHRLCAVHARGLRGRAGRRSRAPGLARPGLQRPCGPGHGHTHGPGADRGGRARSAFGAPGHGAGPHGRRAQPGPDHCQRQHPDLGRAAAPRRRPGARAAAGAGRAAMERGGGPAPGTGWRGALCRWQRCPRTRLWRSAARPATAADAGPAGSGSEAQARQRIPARRPWRGARGHPRQGHGRAELCARCARARHAPWPRHPPSAPGPRRRRFHRPLPGGRGARLRGPPARQRAGGHRGRLRRRGRRPRGTGHCRHARAARAMAGRAAGARSV